MGHPRSFSSAAGLVLALAATSADGAEWPDPPGDVTSAHADIVATSASVVHGMVDLRVQFRAFPFPITHTHSVVWFFDMDQDPSTAKDPDFPGIDLTLSVDSPTGSYPQAYGIEGVTYCFHGSFDSAEGSSVLRMLFPAALIRNDAEFNYAVISSFGGSFGRDDEAPNDYDFEGAGFFQSDSDPVAPIDTTPLCGPVGIDIEPERPENLIGPPRRPLKVAILSSETLDAPTEIEQFRLTFGRTGEEPSWISCDELARDVNGDGLLDLICFFDPERARFRGGDRRGYLKAIVPGGRFLYSKVLLGSDSIRFRATGPRDRQIETVN